MWSGALVSSINVLLAGDGLLYLFLLFADIAGLALLIRCRRRRAKLAAAQAWTEPLDLDTLRTRMRIVEPETRSTQLPRTRELLDEIRRQKTEPSARVSGVAGSSRRR